MINNIPISKPINLSPLLAEEGWRDSLIEAGAPGAEREPDRAKPQLMVSSAKCCVGLTTPAALFRWLRGILLMAQPPLLCEEGNVKFSLPPNLQPSAAL